MLLGDFNMPPDRVAEAALDRRQGTEMPSEAGKRRIFKIEDDARRAGSVPCGCRVRPDCSGSPERNRRSQRRFGDHAVKAEITCHSGFIGGRNFKQDTRRMRARQPKLFLSTLAGGRGDNEAFYRARRRVGIEPDAEQAARGGGSGLPEMLRCI